MTSATAAAPSYPDTQEAVATVREHTNHVPRLALVLGSGLGDLAEAAEEAITIPTTDLPGYPHSTVAGHDGQLVFGRIEGVDVVFIRGRVHLYEGHPVRAVAFPIRLVYALGARQLLVTNAAGGINPRCTPGSLMFITDHINFAFANPLVGPNDPAGPRFPDMSEPYDSAWVDRAEALALANGMATERGTYIWTRGPSYETQAEIQAYRLLGADAVGMSTVPEVIQAQHAGMQVLGLSTITNYAAGLGEEPLDHDDVLAVGQDIRATLEQLVRLILRDLPA